jgi:hypothetical protein
LQGGEQVDDYIIQSSFSEENIFGEIGKLYPLDVVVKTDKANLLKILVLTVLCQKMTVLCY